MSKKKLKDTAVGKFLGSAGSDIIGSLGNVLPDKGVFGIVKNLIKKDPKLPLEDKLKWKKYLNAGRVICRVIRGYLRIQDHSL